jgi:hypothetical protein
MISDDFWNHWRLKSLKLRIELWYDTNWYNLYRLHRSIKSSSVRAFLGGTCRRPRPHLWICKMIRSVPFGEALRKHTVIHGSRHSSLRFGRSPLVTTSHLRRSTQPMACWFLWKTRQAASICNSLNRSTDVSCRSNTDRSDSWNMTQLSAISS